MREREVKSTLVDKYKFVTFALDSVNLSTVYRKHCEGTERRLKRRHQGTWDPRIPPSHTREDGPTVQLRGDSVCKWINGECSLGQEFRGRIGQVQKKKIHSWWKRKITSPISKIDDFVKHVFREHNQEAEHWAHVGGRRTEKNCY